MITQSLPGITSLGYVPSDRLQRQIMQKALAGLPVGVFTDIAPINFVGVPTCVTQSDYDNNGRLEKASLKFVTNDNIPIYKDIAFVMTDSNGKSWLLGTKERPRPIIRMYINASSMISAGVLISCSRGRSPNTASRVSTAVVRRPITREAATDCFILSASPDPKLLPHTMEKPELRLLQKKISISNTAATEPMAASECSPR